MSIFSKNTPPVSDITRKSYGAASLLGAALVCVMVTAPSYAEGIANFAPVRNQTEKPVLTQVVAHIAVIDLKGDQKRIEKGLPVIANTKSFKDFYRKLGRNYRGYNTVYSGTVTYVQNQNGTMPYPLTFAQINGESCFSLYTGKQLNTPDGVTGRFVNGPKPGIIDIHVASLHRAENDPKCRVFSSEKDLMIASGSLNNMFALSYDPKQKIERVIYVINEERHHMNLNR